MNIRPFAPRDRDQVVALWRDSGLIVSQNDPDKDISRKVSHSPDWFLVGEMNGEIVGSVMMGYDGHRGTVNYLAVKPSLQGQGLGRALMAIVEQVLRECGCPKINIDVRISNRDTLSFYKKLEYTEDACIPLGKRLINDQGALGDFLE